MKCLSWNFTYEGERFKCINWKETAVRMSDCTRLVLLQTNHSNTTLFSHTLRRLFQNRIYSRLLIKQFNLNLYNRTLSIYFIIKRKKEKSTIPSNKLFARCQSSMLERTGEGRGGEREDERNCNEDAVGEKRWKAESKRNPKTGQRLKGKEKTFIEREPRRIRPYFSPDYQVRRNWRLLDSFPFLCPAVPSEIITLSVIDGPRWSFSSTRRISF